MTVLQADRVTKQYRMGELTVNALDTVNFAVEKGEFVAIMGPSGSGKSTLLHLLGGLDGTSDGEITLAGKALSKLNDNEVTLVRRRNVGFIFQFYNLVPTLTAEENIALPLLIDGRNLDQYRSKIDELLNLVGPDGSTASQTRSAERRPTAARGDRAGVRHRSRHCAGRRADGQPRFQIGQSDSGTAASLVR